MHSKQHQLQSTTKQEQHQSNYPNPVSDTNTNRSKPTMPNNTLSHYIHQHTTAAAVPPPVSMPSKNIKPNMLYYHTLSSSQYNHRQRRPIPQSQPPPIPQQPQPQQQLAYHRE